MSIASRSVIAAYRPFLEPLRLTHPQYLVMVALWQHGPVFVKELGELLTLDSGTLSPLLKRLESGGLLRRERHAADERQVLISLTSRGQELRADAERVQDDVVRHLGLSDDDLEQLQNVLRRVLEATGLPARPAT